MNRSRMVSLTMFSAILFSGFENAQADIFLDTGGVFTTISVPGAIPGSSSGQGINSIDQIVGFINDGEQGFLYSGGIATPIKNPNGGSTTPYGIMASSILAVRSPHSTTRRPGPLRPRLSGSTTMAKSWDLSSIRLPWPSLALR
jgi:hypothetical protein